MNHCWILTRIHHACFPTDLRYLANNKIKNTETSLIKWRKVRRTLEMLLLDSGQEALRTAAKLSGSWIIQHGSVENAMSGLFSQMSPCPLSSFTTGKLLLPLQEYSWHVFQKKARMMFIFWSAMKAKFPKLRSSWPTSENWLWLVTETASNHLNYWVYHGNFKMRCTWKITLDL